MNSEKFALPAVSMIVVNKNSEILLQQRNKNEILKFYLSWELPQGKLRENENLNECISRELFEETGITEFNLQTTVLNENVCGEELSGANIFSVVQNGQLSYLAICVVINSNGIPHETDEAINHKWFTKEEINRLLERQRIFPLNVLMLRFFIDL